MIIGDRIRQIRDYKNLSQGEIERRTGLLRCYVSRVEQGHTTPSIETLQKFARALEVPMYHLFYDGEKPPAATVKSRGKGFGMQGHEARTLMRFRRLLSHTKPKDVKLLLLMAQAMSQRKRRR